GEGRVMRRAASRQADHAHRRHEGAAIECLDRRLERSKATVAVTADLGGTEQHVQKATEPTHRKSSHLLKDAIDTELHPVGGNGPAGAIRSRPGAQSGSGWILAGPIAVLVTTRSAPRGADVPRGPGRSDREPGGSALPGGLPGRCGPHRARDGE